MPFYSVCFLNKKVPFCALYLSPMTSFSHTVRERGHVLPALEAVQRLLWRVALRGRRDFIRVQTCLPQRLAQRLVRDSLDG